jgi:hypothetical protein
VVATSDDRSPLIAVGEEAGKARTFVWAVDWPGWCRGGRSRDLALAALASAAGRYALVAAEAGLRLESRSVDPAELGPGQFMVVEMIAGSTSTDFGVPGSVTELDRRAVDAAEAGRQSGLVQAAWTTLDQVASRAPAELRKGPRGGGRDRDKIVAHCDASDAIYAGQLGLRFKDPAQGDRQAVEAVRRAILEVLARPSDGSPIAGRRWPARYAARRIAWHALDHAWEIEDRS